MAGRKRKTLALIETAAPVSTGSKHKSVSPAKLKKSTFSSDDQSAETETSHYFAKNGSTQHKLGEDFFRQPCVSLAKALLGMVGMPPPRSFFMLNVSPSWIKIIFSVPHPQSVCVPCAGVGPQVCRWHRAAGENSGDWSLPRWGGHGVTLSGRETHREEHGYVHEAWHNLRVPDLWHLLLHEHI